MNVSTPKVKYYGSPGAAPLKNIAILHEIVHLAQTRAIHLPGIVTFSGPSGFGKSTAAAYVAAQTQAYHVELKSHWSKKPFLEALLKAMGIPAARTISDMADQVAQELAASQRPLILDEFDYAVVREGMIDLVRDIYEQSNAPIVLIGEEKLPIKLKKWERFDGRIMDWAQAMPADLCDARALNAHYNRGIKVEDDLLQVLVSMSNGSVRRIVTNLERIASFAQMEGLKSIGMKQWGNQPLHTAQPPKTRGF